MSKKLSVLILALLVSKTSQNADFKNIEKHEHKDGSISFRATTSDGDIISCRKYKSDIHCDKFKKGGDGDWKIYLTEDAKRCFSQLQYAYEKKQEEKEATEQKR